MLPFCYPLHSFHYVLSIGEQIASLQVRVKPNVTSWRGLNVNGIFGVCQNLTTSEKSLQGTKNLDSHMMKNTQWGAAEYLSSSRYGKTDSSGNRLRVYNNPYSNGTTNHSPITGLAGATANQGDSDQQPIYRNTGSQSTYYANTNLFILLIIKKEKDCKNLLTQGKIRCIIDKHEIKAMKPNVATFL